MAETIWTIGHSTRPIDELLALLAEHRIEALADIRRYPGSRRWPQFGSDALSHALAARALLYLHLPELGGRRRPVPGSPNTGWRSEAFRGYADYMLTTDFAVGLERLVNMACGLRTAIMCAEAIWWRCHRALVADALRWCGLDVRHILGRDAATRHPYTSVARLVNGELLYGLP